MRRALVILVSLVACGKRDDGKRPAERPAPEPDERCDPAQPRVCIGANLVECEPEGRLGRRLRSCKDGCKDGACVATCDATGVELIYVVDDASNLLSFDPRKLPGDPFQLIGRLTCSSRGTPFSMAVDRSGIAWIVYSTGELFKVSIADARCTRSGFVPRSSGSATFGMGFVTDDAGGKTEKLYISANDGSRALSYIDTSGTPTARYLGRIEATIDHHPELTGTSEGKLFGFFPNEYQPSFVQEIDRATGAARGPQWKLGDGGLGYVQAYAFAHWGGSFYIFVTSGSSTVRVVDRTTGEYRTVMESIPYRITGAGVSTCAPERDQSPQQPPRPP